MERILSEDTGSGSGSSLPLLVLLVAGISTFVAVLVSAMSIYLHLKNYLKPSLQRYNSSNEKFYSS
jgi:hypothetical protein